jgi:hypothetical protein
MKVKRFLILALIRLFIALSVTGVLYIKGFTNYMFLPILFSFLIESAIGFYSSLELNYKLLIEHPEIYEKHKSFFANSQKPGIKLSSILNNKINIPDDNSFMENCEKFTVSFYFLLLNFALLIIISIASVYL